MSQRFASQPCGRAAEDAADDSVQEGVPYRRAGCWYTSDETIPHNGHGLRVSSRWGGEKLSDWCVGFVRESDPELHTDGVGQLNLYKTYG